MRVSNPFKILGKVDMTTWGCLIQFSVLLAIVGLMVVGLIYGDILVVY